MLLRTGPYGDRFGLRRGGLNLDKLRAHLTNGALRGAALPLT